MMLEFIIAVLPGVMAAVIYYRRYIRKIEGGGGERIRGSCCFISCFTLFL